MQKFMTRSFTLAVVALFIFRVILALTGWGQDGNFLILVIVPFLFFWSVLGVGKWFYRHYIVA